MIIESIFFIPCITIFLIVIIISISLIYKARLKSNQNNQIINNYDYSDYSEPHTHILLKDTIRPICDIEQISFSDENYKIFIVSHQKGILMFDYKETPKKYKTDKNYIIRILIK